MLIGHLAVELDRRPVLYNETALSRKAWADAQEIRNG